MRVRVGPRLLDLPPSHQPRKPTKQRPPRRRQRRPRWRRASSRSRPASSAPRSAPRCAASAMRCARLPRRTLAQIEAMVRRWWRGRPLDLERTLCVHWRGADLVQPTSIQRHAALATAQKVAERLSRRQRQVRRSRAVGSSARVTRRLPCASWPAAERRFRFGRRRGHTSARFHSRRRAGCADGSDARLRRGGPRCWRSSSSTRSRCSQHAAAMRASEMRCATEWSRGDHRSASPCCGRRGRGCLFAWPGGALVDQIFSQVGEVAFAVQVALADRARCGATGSPRRGRARGAPPRHRLRGAAYGLLGRPATDFKGFHVVEESCWAALHQRRRPGATAPGDGEFYVGVCVGVIAVYVAFMLAVDVPGVPAAVARRRRARRGVRVARRPMANRRDLVRAARAALVQPVPPEAACGRRATLACSRR